MKKGFLKKKERVKGFFIFMTMHFYSSILNLTTIRKPCEQDCNRIIKFSHCLTFDTINIELFFQFKLKMALHTAYMKKKKSVK